MPQAIDMEYCMIVIDKLISPHTPVEQVEPLLRDLMDSVYHPQMKELAQKIVDPELDIVERRKLKEKFRNFDHGGANDYSEVNYKDLIDKFLDPDLPDHDYKPTMKALLDGDLDQDKKNMVSAIISCQNKDQKANMVKRFKSLFDREKEDRERALKERAEAKAAKEKAKSELEANLLKFSDDGMTLIHKFLDKKIPREKKTEIYDRLMEPDIDAEIKNLAIQIVNTTKASERPQLIEDFKKRREEEKIMAVKRKEEEARRKAEEEKGNKDLKMQRKQQLLMQKKKSDMMKKRDLMLKYRAEERKRDSQYGVVGPSSVQEREAWRKKEREKMRMEILRFREESRLKMMKQEREDRLKQGWLVTSSDSSYNINIRVVVPDLATLLSPVEQHQYNAALAALHLYPVSEKKTESEKPKEIDQDEKNPEQTPEKVEEKVDNEFEKYFKIFVDPSLTEEAESTHVKQLIKDKKSALVRSLAVKLASVPGAGKSKVFQTLIKKFCPEKVNSNQPTVNIQKVKSEDEAMESPFELMRESSKLVNGTYSKDNCQEESQENGIQNTSKRRLSQDSNDGNESKKLKLVNVFEGDRGKEEKGENESSKEKKKKKKHKHKDDKKKVRQEDMVEGKIRRGDEKKKKHKNKEKYKKRERGKETETSEEENQKASTETRDSKSGNGNIKPLLEMSMAEIKQMFNLKNFNASIRIKNCRKLFRVIQKQDEERDRRGEELSKESESSTRPRQTTRSPSRPKSSASSNPVRSRSNSVRSKTPIRSRSNSVISRSPSRSRSVISRSPIRSRSNSSRSRSPIRSSPCKSISPNRSPSIRSSSRSNSP